MSDWDGFSGPHPSVIITTHAATFRYISALRLFTHATAVSGQQVAVMISVIKLYQKHAYSRKIETNIQRLFDTEKERREKRETHFCGWFVCSTWNRFSSDNRTRRQVQYCCFHSLHTSTEIPPKTSMTQREKSNCTDFPSYWSQTPFMAQPRICFWSFQGLTVYVRL